MIDNTQWSEIYKKHSKKMLWVCRRYVNDISLAEDLMHEGFIAAMQKQSTFSGFGSFEGWLRTIMVNTSLMHLRKTKTSLFVSDIDISENAPVINDMNSTYDIKSKIINTDFTRQELLEVVEAIPEHHKIVFNMYVIDNFSHNEISKTLNITANTSKSHLLRARKKIQELLLLKANEKEQKKNRRKLFFWFLFTGNYIDSIYAKEFSSFGETPSKTFNINDYIAQQKLPEKITSGYIFGITLQKFVIASAVMALMIFAVLNFTTEATNDINAAGHETTILDTKTGNGISNTKSLEKESIKRQDNKLSGAEHLTNREGNKPDTVSKGKVKSALNALQPKKPPKKNKDKKPIVIKKIIDTVYVYK